MHKANTLKRNSLVVLGLLVILQGCGGGGSGPEDGSGLLGVPGAEQGMDAAGTVATESGRESAEAPPAEVASKLVSVGFQAVSNTPVSSVPSHKGHEPLVKSVAVPVNPPNPATWSYKNEWVVSEKGNDTFKGDAASPFRTISKAVSVASPGDIIRVLDGTYAESLNIGASAKAGTQEAPITLQGEGAPRIVPASGTMMVEISRPYWIIDGFQIDAEKKKVFPVAFSGNTQGSVLANCDIRNGMHGAGVNVYGSSRGAVIENNHIHDFGSGSMDSHGVVVQTTTKNTTVRNNDIHDVSGDSVQCLGPEGYSSNAPADGLVIENNHFFMNRENAVDIKTCKNVVIRNNRMHDFLPSKTSKGEAVVIHLSASNVLVEGNDIYNAGKGIAVGGVRVGALPSKVVLRYNRIHDLVNSNGAEGAGIRLENSEGAQLVNNTVTNVPGYALVLGHGTGGETKGLKVRNNIFDATKAIDAGDYRPGLQMDNNLFRPDAEVLIAGVSGALSNWQAQGFDKKSGQTPPIADPSSLKPTEAAVDRGEDTGLPFCGGAPDLGAVEADCD